MVTSVGLIGHHCLSHFPVAAVAGQRNACIVVGVDRLAEVDRVLELLLQHFAARVAWHLQQEEACVALGKKVIWRVVLVQNLASNNHNHTT